MTPETSRPYQLPHPHPHPARNPWTLFGWWVTFQAIIAAGTGLCSALINNGPIETYTTTPHQLAVLLLTIGTALALAIAQAIVIARAFPIHPALWTLATTAALLITALLSWGLNTFISQIAFVAEQPVSTLSGLFFLSTLIVAALGGLLHGGLQAILLAPHTTAPLLWFGTVAAVRFIVSALSALLTSALITLLLTNASTGSALTLIGGINAGVNFLATLLTATLTGLLLVVLIPPPRPTPHPPPPM
jgi:hypothetical protein